ncbi:hypothetical protein V6N13_005238 [Hibiscus sabdariffa]
MELQQRRSIYMPDMECFVVESYLNLANLLCVFELGFQSKKSWGLEESRVMEGEATKALTNQGKMNGVWRGACGTSVRRGFH